MPLYTYVVTYKGDTYVAQDKKSNFKGFISSWTRDMPAGAMKALTPSLTKELQNAAYYGEFPSVPGRKNVWRKSFLLGGSEFVVVAVQTET